MRVQTSVGPAEVAFDATPDPRFLLVMTHGASGGVDTADLVAVRDAAVEIGGAVARVLQPFRVAGARAPGSAAKQDAAWVELVTKLRRKVPGVPLIQGGRSNGARVACRTAHESGADGVLCLSFPLHPPGKPEASRAEELRAPLPHGIPLHVVQGEADPFGTPGEVRAELPDPAMVTAAKGAHAFAKNPTDVLEAVRAFLGGLA